MWSAISSAQSILGINLHPSSTSLGFQHPMSLQGLMGMCFSAGLGEDGGWEGGEKGVKVLMQVSRFLLRPKAPDSGFGSTSHVF